MKTKNKDIEQFLRFCIVGVICTGIDAGLFFLVRQFAPYQIALVSGYLFSLVVNYILTVYWTFSSRATVKNAVGVVAAHLINLFVVRMGLMYLFVEQAGMSDSVAYFPTLVISVVINFIMIKTVVDKL